MISRIPLSLGCVIAVASAGAAAAAAIGAADGERAWRAPFELALPDPVRALIVREGEDAQAFVVEHGLDAARVISVGRGITVVETPMSEARWADAQQTLCTDSRVASCESTACQSIQLSGSADAGSHDADRVQARIVRNPPEAPPVVDAAMLEASCRLSPAPEPADTEAKRSFEFSLTRSVSAPGVVSLGTDSLPEDTSDWTMVVGAGCSEVRVPLDSVEPARAPGRVVAIVASGAAPAVAAASGLTVVREISLVTTEETLVVFATGTDIAQALAALALDDRVSEAQPEYVYRTTADRASATTSPDPLSAQSYGPRQTGAQYLHAATRGAGQLVVVIDTGVAREHAEFAGRVREGIDVTGYGFSADAHGTAVAGVIAAEANNGVGIFGVAPGVEVLPVKACQPREPNGVSARCWTSTLVQALDVAIQANARLINMSVSGPPDPFVGRFVRVALDADILVVAGAGNGGHAAKPGFPAAIPGVVAVTAVDAAQRLYSQANLGDYVDVAAPGVDIVAPTPGGDFPALSGTSIAAAHVTGVAALIGALVPALGGAEIASTLVRSAKDLGDPGMDARFGAGLLDACGAAGIATLGTVTCGARESADLRSTDAAQAD